MEQKSSSMSKRRKVILTISSITVLAFAVGMVMFFNLFSLELVKKDGTIIQSNNMTPVENNSPANNTSSSGQNNQGQYIGEDQAKTIALADASHLEAEVTGLRVKLDREDNIMVYDVEFRNGQIEYEYEIDAISGNVLKKDVDHDDDWF